MIWTRAILTGRRRVGPALAYQEVGVRAAPTHHPPTVRGIEQHALAAAGRRGAATPRYVKWQQQQVNYMYTSIT